ncbi:MAG: anaerobic glycerol-3-phosphate dehydrogenase subunit B [Desulfobacteraceae bacterium]|nr:anaerobic glycerol-3-phosphate dehydrogenase subunit B [Desulfobacteraceae bacterium]
MSRPTINCDLLVIGSGMAGMAASLFAAKKGINIVQAGMTSELSFASGLLDLMGVHPAKESRIWDNPWAGIETLIKDIPDHPYAHMKKEDIRQALDEFMAFLNSVGLPYKANPDRNSQIVTPVGTVKTTYCVPRSMWNGVKALQEKQPCLLADFIGLKGFSARQIKEAFKEKWPSLRSARFSFPSHAPELYTEHMARELEKPETCQKLAEDILPYVKDSQVVGLPAVLGITRNKEVVSNMEKYLNVPVFEIPTIPPSVAGIRLKKIFEVELPKLGVKPLLQQKVTRAESSGNTGDLIFEVGSPDSGTTVCAKGVILASGRFFGKGLYSDREGVYETIFNLPVHQPDSRSYWHEKDLFDTRGHMINQAGLETDEFLRPLDKSGGPAFNTLFAAGSILAHQDWIRMKCGAGLAIATACHAVNSFLEIKNS